jgi:hypothetical protein
MSQAPAHPQFSLVCSCPCPCHLVCTCHRCGMLCWAAWLVVTCALPPPRWWSAHGRAPSPSCPTTDTCTVGAGRPARRGQGPFRGHIYSHCWSGSMLLKSGTNMNWYMAAVSASAGRDSRVGDGGMLCPGWSLQQQHPAGTLPSLSRPGSSKRANPVTAAGVWLAL